MANPITIKIRGYHLDVYRHVNNARYLEFFEEARWAFLEESELIKKLTERGIGFAVVNININFRQPARLDDLVDITTSVKSFSERSGTLLQVMTYHGTDKIVADAEITYVMFDMHRNKAVPIEGDIKEALEQAAKS